MSASPDLTAPTATIWETGLHPQRVSYLAALRRTNPEQARIQLEAVWMREGYEEQVAFLRTFEIGLSMEDEPFLEAALDRRKKVRAAAQELLRTLPESRLCQRMKERATPLLSVKANRLEVTLPPTSFVKAMARDGIEQKEPGHQNLSGQTFWFKQILAATPLDFWTAQLGHSPERLVTLAIASGNWREVLLTGWTEALANQAGASEWAEPLWNYWMGQRAHTPSREIPWQRVLPTEHIEAVLLKGFDLDALDRCNSPLRLLLEGYDSPWSNALTNRFLEEVRKPEAWRSQYLIHVISKVADRFPEARLNELYEVWRRTAAQTQYSDHHRKQFEQHVAQTLKRREMRQHTTGV
jgi:hypothetical protein